MVLVIPVYDMERVEAKDERYSYQDTDAGQGVAGI